MWFVCGDMGGELMYDLNLTGSIGLITVSYTHLYASKKGEEDYVPSAKYRKTF